MFCLSPSIWIWVSSGMETPLIVLLQVAIWANVEAFAAGESRRSLVFVCLAQGLLVLARADGFVTGAIVTAYFVVTRRPAAARSVFATTVGVFLAMVSLRYLYYGAIWPLTYYAKVTTTLPKRVLAALSQFGGVASRHGVLPYEVALLFASLAWLRNLRVNGALELRTVPFGVFFSVAWMSYWFYIGGDNFEDRFLLPLIPITVTLIFQLLGAEGRVAWPMFVTLALALQLSPVVRDERFGKQLRRKYDYRVELGKYIGAHWPGKVLATPAAGKIPFYSRLKTIDMLGLTDAHIAHVQPATFIPGHSKEDSEYVLGRKPDLIAGLLWGDELGIGVGLDEAQYEPAGYRVRLLVNSTAVSRGPEDILDVSARSHDELLLLAHRGWRGVLLERYAPTTERPN